MQALVHLKNFQAGCPRTMPKNKRGGKKASTSGKATETLQQTSGPVYTTNTGGVAIRVYAKPGASVSRITDISNDSVGIQIAAPPVDGEANTELVRFLSKLLNLRKTDVSLEKGARSKEKVVVVTSQVGASDVLHVLKKQLES
uniref:Uncharacterized protein n=1 Tax=Amblyomma triste TaxID=251400 RepID=A0A023G5U3_AMBTT